MNVKTTKYFTEQNGQTDPISYESPSWEDEKIDQVDIIDDNWTNKTVKSNENIQIKSSRGRHRKLITQNAFL